MLVKIKVLFLNCESVNTTVFENNFIHELNLCLRKVSGTFARQLTDLISFGPNSVVFSRRDLINSSFTFSLHLPPALAISLSLPRSFSFSLLFCPLTVSSFFLFFFNSFVSSILCTLHSLSLSVARLSPVCAQTDIRGSPRHVVLCSSDEMCQGWQFISTFVMCDILKVAGKRTDLLQFFFFFNTWKWVGNNSHSMSFYQIMIKFWLIFNKKIFLDFFLTLYYI